MMGSLVAEWRVLTSGLSGFLELGRRRVPRTRKIDGPCRIWRGLVRLFRFRSGADEVERSRTLEKCRET